MRDVGRCAADGYSTAGSSGNGLGAICANGGCICALFESRVSAPSCGLESIERRPETAGHDVADRAGRRGNSSAGRGSLRRRAGRRPSAMAGASFSWSTGLVTGSKPPWPRRRRCEFSAAHQAQEPAQIVESIHAVLRSTRGAALAIARLDRVGRQVHYAGVGNISGVIRDTATGARTSMVSQNGTVGYAVRKVQTYQYPWNDDSLLLMHSDGLATHWDVDRYPGLLQMHPSLIAGVLYRDYSEGAMT